MNSGPRQTDYQRLIQKAVPPPVPQRTVESDLDSLLTTMRQQEAHKPKTGGGPTAAEARLQALREQIVRDFVPVFQELMEKYTGNGIVMDMDASVFLEGGREIRMEFAFGEYRSVLVGTVTPEAVAFHETRYTPEMRGELVSGPALRLRQLNEQTFREFVCERLALLLRTAMKRR